ncbi:MAG TPA: hypothetical protein VM054_04005 [bacterium]|nr:hypothetical protein [bacterium]
MKTIKFHSHLSIHFVDAMIKRCNELSETKDEVTLDFSNVLSIKPFAISLLYHSIKQYFRNFKRLYIIEPRSQGTREYLKSSGFYGQATTRKLNRTTFELTPISKHYEQKVLEYLEIIKDQVPYLHDNILFITQLCMNELTTNVKDHSESPFGCVVCGQIYSKKKQIHISISDYGIGFLNSLLTVKKDLSNDIEAIKTAVETQVTTRKQAVGGMGLQHIKVGILNVNGNVSYLSGLGMVTYEKQKKKTRRIVKKLTAYVKGVTIYIIIPLVYTDEQTLFEEISDDLFN